MSSDINAASWEQPCDALRGSVLWANPGAALQGTQMLHKTGEKGNRLGRAGGMAAPGKAEPGIHLGRRIRDGPGSAGRVSAVEKSNPTSPQCRILSRTPKELRSGVTNRDRVGRGSGTRQVTQGLPWDLPSAQDQHSCITGDGEDGTVQRCSGAGCGADSGQCRRVGPTVSCPWPAAKPAPCPQKSLHFRVAENLHPPFQKVTLR